MGLRLGYTHREELKTFPFFRSWGHLYTTKLQLETVRRNGLQIKKSAPLKCRLYKKYYVVFTQQLPQTQH